MAREKDLHEGMYEGTGGVALKLTQLWAYSQVKGQDYDSHVLAMNEAVIKSESKAGQYDQSALDGINASGGGHLRLDTVCSSCCTSACTCSTRHVGIGLLLILITHPHERTNAHAPDIVSLHCAYEHMNPHAHAHTLIETEREEAWRGG